MIKLPLFLLTLVSLFMLSAQNAEARRYDEQTGLYTYKHRHYKPSKGRFMHRDPIEEAGGTNNVYEYARNDPFNKFDTLGLKCYQVCGRVMHRIVTPQHKDKATFPEELINGFDDYKHHFVEAVTGETFSFPSNAYNQFADIPEVSDNYPNHSTVSRVYFIMIDRKDNCRDFEKKLKQCFENENKAGGYNSLTRNCQHVTKNCVESSGGFYSTDGMTRHHEPGELGPLGGP